MSFVTQLILTRRVEAWYKEVTGNICMLSAYIFNFFFLLDRHSYNPEFSGASILA